MADLLYVVRYFGVVPPIPRLMMASFVVLTVAGAMIIGLVGDGDGTAVEPILVLQVFSASTGFAAPARRGYFDLLLARGHSRVRIAVLQWLIAILPGLVGWAALTLTWSLSQRADNPLLQSGTVIAFVMASTIPWAANIGLPRFAGGIGWLLLVCLMNAGGVIWPDSVQDVLFPAALVGGSMAGRADVGAVAVALSVLSMTMALVWVHRTDVRLEAAQ